MSKFALSLLLSCLLIVFTAPLRAAETWLPPARAEEPWNEKGNWIDESLDKPTHRLPGMGEEKSLLMAAADSADAGDGPETPLSPECRELAQDDRADLADVFAAGCEPTLAQMSKLMDNPLGNVAMWFNQFDFIKLKNDRTGKTADQFNYTGIFQFPKSVSKNWNLINRVIYTVPSAPLNQGRIDRLKAFQQIGQGPGILPPGGPAQPPAGPSVAPIDVLGGRTTGFGDMYYVGLLSPKEGIKHKNGGTSVWGLGGDISFPTASEAVLGSGKWAAGPSALYAYLGRKWKLGGLLQQYFSFAGSDTRSDVNTTNLQVFYYYSINPTMSIGAGPNIIADWEQNSSNRWTLPIGIGINKTVQLGRVPTRFVLEAYYSAVRPDDVGSDWSLRFIIIPSAPSAKFKWMQ